MPLPLNGLSIEELEHYRSINPMLEQSIPASRAAEAARIAAAVSQFSGQITTLPGFKYVPAPPRTDPHPEQVRLGELRSLARRGCSMRYAAMCMNLTKDQVAHLAKRNGVKFRGRL